ncbi:MAG: hypothetical protein IPK82_40325 [Polyangiaceae bacterium]|nr:hypothetical protein [Polyangiaceae bacterium]
MGVTNPASTGNATFQKLLTAVNKRLVRCWIGEIKRRFGSSADLVPLVDWFGSTNGRSHFEQWCQALGTQGGDRKQSTSAHGKGKAIDMNYDHNPWIPLCTTNGNSMVGEDHARTEDGLELFKKHFGDPSTVFVECGHIYDRALRLFVPLVTTTTDPHGTGHFSSRYYRIHHDWTPTRTPTLAPPYTAEQVYEFYQVLSWSLRFYFDYAYGQCSVARTASNVYTKHSPPDPLVMWQRIETDWKEMRLPQSAEIHTTDAKSIPKSVSALFDKVTLKYSYDTGGVKVSRFKLQTGMAQITTDDMRKDMASVFLKQIAADHDMVSRGMVTKAPGRRDPCAGVFNHCFEVVMAFCYMLSDPDTKNLRTFGAFSASAGGDLQHFDYGHRSR